MKKYLDIFASAFGDISVPTPENRPKISILCAHYNNHEYLPDFISSLQWQRYDNWEAVIVDDCSTMGDPADIVAAAQDPRIIYHRLEKNSGACAARNAAFARSSGDFVLCMDPDDILHPEFFSALAAYSAPNEKQIVMFDYISFGKQTGLCRTTPKGMGDFLREQWIPGVSMISRQQYAAVGGWDTADVLRYGNQDWEFWLNVLEHYPDIKIIHIPLPLMLYRQHGEAISSRRVLHDHETRKYILHKHQALFDRFGAGDSFLAEGYAISASYRLFFGDVYGAARGLSEGMRTCPTRRLCRLLPGKLKGAFLQTRLGKSLHPWLRGVKRAKNRCLAVAGKVLYASPFGRKLFWKRHAHYLFERYGKLKGGYDSLVPVLERIKPKILLEVGCGNGRLFQAYREAGVKKIVGQDISSSAIQYAKERYFPEAELYLADIQDIAFNDTIFDLTVCNRVLQHIPPESIEGTIKKICDVSQKVYINEMTHEEYSKIENNHELSYYIFIYDYQKLFNKYGFMKESSWVVNEGIEKWQHRYIFSRQTDLN